MVIKMKKHNATLFGVLVYVLKNNYLIFVYLFIPLLMRQYQNVSYFTAVIFIPVSLILFLFLPKKVGDINYNEILNKSYVAKAAYNVVQFLMLILNVILVGYSVGRMFFYEYNILLFIIPTILITIYISTSEVEVIFNSSSFLYIVAILLIVIPVFLANEVKDFTLLMPFYEFDGFLFLFILYFILDAISILLCGVKTDKKITKWKLFIPVGVMLFFMCLELMNIIIITGDSYLIDNEFLGFFTLFIQDTINYIGNLGPFFLYVIPVVGCYKAGFSLRNLKNTFKFKDSLFNNILLFIIMLFIVTIVTYYFDIPKFSIILIAVSTVLLGITYLFVILNRSLNYEIHF